MIQIGKTEVGEFPLFLSPMEDVTDPPFREICKDYGVDVLVTEFISSDALIRKVGKSLKKLDFSEQERPLGIQIYGHDEVSLCQAAEMAAEKQPDFVDINWGCPVRKVVARGAGSGILQDVPKMIRLTQKIVDVLQAVGMPVTVKTRLGWDENDKPIVRIAEALQDVGVVALSIHGRTRAQLYKGEADWTLIGEVCDNPRMYIPIFGNGDINTPEKALEYKNKYKVSGMLIGRGAIGTPWIFRQIKQAFAGKEISLPTMEERISIVCRHLQRSIEWKCENVAIHEIKKHYPGYFRGVPSFKTYKTDLMRTQNLQEAQAILNCISNDFCSTFE